MKNIDLSEIIFRGSIRGILVMRFRSYFLGESLIACFFLKDLVGILRVLSFG